MSKKRVIIPNNLSEDFLQDTTDKDIKVNIDEVTIKRRNDDKLYVDRNELNLEEIADRARPFVKEGETSATNDDDVSVGDNVFHTGKVSVGTNEFEDKFDLKTNNFKSKVNKTELSFIQGRVFVFVDDATGTDNLEDHEYVEVQESYALPVSTKAKVKTLDKALDICKRSNSNFFMIIFTSNTFATAHFINKVHVFENKMITIMNTSYSGSTGHIRFGITGTLIFQNSSVQIMNHLYLNRNNIISLFNSDIDITRVNLEGNITTPFDFGLFNNLKIAYLTITQDNQSLVAANQSLLVVNLGGISGINIFLEYPITGNFETSIVQVSASTNSWYNIHFSERFTSIPTNIKFGRNIRIHHGLRTYQGKNFLIAGDEQYLNIIKGAKPFKFEDIQNDVEGDDIQFLTGLDANGGMWKVPKSLFVNGNWVTIDTDQTITGQKNFKNYISFEDFLGGTHPHKMVIAQANENFAFGKLDDTGLTAFMGMSPDGTIYVVANDLKLSHNLRVAGNANILGDYNTGGNGTITGNLAVNGNTVLLGLNTKMGFNTPAPTHVIHISTLSPDALRIQAPLVLQNTSRVLTWDSSTGNVGYSDVVIKRRDTYTGTTLATGLVTITFTTPFTAVPNIQATQIGGSNTNILKVTAVTTTNVKVQVVNRVEALGLLPTFTNVTGAIVDIIATEK